MELEAAKMIGAGLACSALIGAGVGIGNIFGNYLSGAMRNPSAAPAQFTNLLIGFALACWLAFWTPSGAVGVWIGLSVGTAVYAVLLLLRFRALASKLTF